MKSIIITGANGQVGRELQVVLGKGDMYSLHFFDSSSLDITDHAAVTQNMWHIKPDFLINAAAYTAVDKAEEDTKKAFAVNAEAVKNLAQLCSKQRCQFIHISSDYVYHNGLDRPLLETDPTTPQGVYAASKLQGDSYAQEQDRNSIILRTSWVYSSFGNNFLKTMIRLGKSRDQLGIVFDQIGAPTYARDIAETIVTILKKVEAEGSKFGGVYNYAPQGVTCWYDYAKAIFELENIDCNVNSIPSKAYPTPAKRPTYSVLNCEKIKETFDLNIPYWKDSVQACLQVLKEQEIPVG